ncbi:MAG: sigma-54-dependent Fis family transcriptional regulator, partial [Candidatus Tectomicrobia bacterium]|nr:sigma-54-dependent Fis family transcriptional regulator [Candidatus Tectomicrobia bacterium]
LRAIQEGEIERVGGTKAITINARLIAATNKNLEQLVRQGEFREDLYYRLNVIPIRLPSLRERRQDIPHFVRFFLERYNRKFKKRIDKITEPALKILCEYDWPGNIRELENLVERLVATVDGATIFEGHIPIEYYFPGSGGPTSPEAEESLSSKGFPLLREACEAFERNFILKVLEKTHWNRTQAAERLGLPLSTLKYKLSKLGLYEFLGEQESSKGRD